jgi:hypothetical protein
MKSKPNKSFYIIIKMPNELQTYKHIFKLKFKPNLPFSIKMPNELLTCTHIQIEISPQLGFQDQNQVAK